MHQHWVPDSYLQAWIDPVRPEEHEPFVHVFDVHGKEHRRRNPRKILRMPELYTFFENGVPNRSIEQHFGRAERDFVRMRGLIEERGYGGPAEVAALYGFTAGMMVRPPNRIQHYTDQWASIADKARRIRVRPDAKPMPSIFSKGPGFTIAQVHRMAEDPMGTWFTASLNAHIRALTTMFQCEILVNGSPYPFVTSDSPAVTHWEGEPPPHPMPRGLGSRGCTITLPISPRHALRFTHGAAGVVDPWPALDWEGVFEFNHLTITRARKVIVSDREDLFFVQAILDHLIRADAAAPDKIGSV